ncbi:hypothetical protein LIER_18385 [Lithospermum erythrorhizon]|uniref:Uncharacterized protein n=1 Tax=Lithospermum erythrorhizon TaxID=34254 RepID=A0AAV3QDZ9_LITER
MASPSRWPEYTPSDRHAAADYYAHHPRWIPICGSLRVMYATLDNFFCWIDFKDLFPREMRLREWLSQANRRLIDDTADCRSLGRRCVSQILDRTVVVIDDALQGASEMGTHFHDLERRLALDWMLLRV